MYVCSCSCGCVDWCEWIVVYLLWCVNLFRLSVHVACVSSVLEAPNSLVSWSTSHWLIHRVHCHWHELESNELVLTCCMHTLYDLLTVPALCIVFSCCARVLLCWCVLLCIHSQFGCACSFLSSLIVLLRAALNCWPSSFAELVNALDMWEILLVWLRLV